MQSDDWFYEAERAVHMRKYPTFLTDPQAYFDYVTGTKFFTVRFPHVAEREITVRFTNHAYAWADFDKNLISLPPWASNDFVLIHEVSHYAANVVDHGPAFRKVELTLVRRFMGKDAGRTLHHAMLAYDLAH